MQTLNLVLIFRALTKVATQATLLKAEERWFAAEFHPNATQQTNIIKLVKLKSNAKRMRRGAKKKKTTAGVEK